jgi:hypothetical protein
MQIMVLFKNVINRVIDLLSPNRKIMKCKKILF